VGAGAGDPRRAYLDHASSSPLRLAAYEAMLPWIAHAGDPGRVHAEGRAARVALEEAREQVAAFFGARPREVVFTSSGTESVNTAVWGAAARSGASRNRMQSSAENRVETQRVADAHIVTSAVEHSAVLEAANRAGRLTMVAVDGFGRYDPATVLAAVRPDTALVSVQLANHEVGTLQPAAETVAAVRERGVLSHVDACAAAGHVPIDFGELGADLCSVTAHKLGGPKGVGALLVRRGLRISPLLLGGAQERNRRAGIENVAAAVGFAAAVSELEAGRLMAEAETARAFTDRLVAETLKVVDGVALFGDPDARLPHLVCFGVEGVEAEPVLLGLDQRNIAVHSGSSCSSETFEPSPVLSAMGVNADHSLRISVGWSTTANDVDSVLAALPDVVSRLRRLRTG